MAIKRPDIIEHNNPNEPIVDTDFVKGGFRTKVADLTALYALSPKVNQMKEHATSVWVISEAKYYTLVDASNVGSSSGWSDSVLGSSNTIVVSSNTTAKNDSQYSNVANATYTDPSPVEGKGYEVKVVNGTATIGSVGYTEGMVITRTFHSGSWRTKVYIDQNIIPDTATADFNLSSKTWNNREVFLVVDVNDITVTLDQEVNTVLIRKIGSKSINFVNGSGRTVAFLSGIDTAESNYASILIQSDGTVDLLQINEDVDLFARKSDYFTIEVLASAFVGTPRKATVTLPNGGLGTTNYDILPQIYSPQAPWFIESKTGTGFVFGFNSGDAVTATVELSIRKR